MKYLIISAIVIAVVVFFSGFVEGQKVCKTGISKGAYIGKMLTLTPVYKDGFKYAVDQCIWKVR